MAVPKYHEFYNIFLQSLEDGEVRSVRECREYIKEKMQLSEEDLAEVNTVSGQPKWINRIGWCTTRLKHAGMISNPKYGSVQITDLGRSLLAENVKITDKILLEKGSPEILDFLNPNRNVDRTNSNETTEDSSSPADVTEEIPEETFERIFNEINSELANELLSRVQSMSPYSFEELTVKLMEKMGYGTGNVTIRSRDHGIDGIIKSDRLGLNRADCIVIQAKKYSDTKVGEPEITRFLGAMNGYGAKKGVFITTSDFSTDARKFAENQGIVLIDGKKLVELMIEFEVGISTYKIYHIKKIDSDFFNED